MNIYKKLVILSAFMGVSILVNGQDGVLINDAASSTTAPDPSAKLEVESTTQGVLVPRMTAAQRGAITGAGGGNPATGLLVYQTDAPNGFWFFDGATWVALSGGTSASSPWRVGAAGTGTIEADHTPVGNIFGIIASGDYALAHGFGTGASGFASHSKGYATRALGIGAHAGGAGHVPFNKDGTFNFSSAVFAEAGGAISFTHFGLLNTVTTNQGAYSDFSAILGGVNHNIPAGSDNSAILGGAGNTINTGSNNSVVLGGVGLTADQSNTAFAQELRFPGNPTAKTTLISVSNSTAGITHNDDPGFNNITLQTNLANYNEGTVDVSAGYINMLSTNPAGYGWYSAFENPENANIGYFVQAYDDATPAISTASPDGRPIIRITDTRIASQASNDIDAYSGSFLARNAMLNAGVMNSMVIGGTGLIADRSNFAFMQNLEVQNGMAYYNGTAWSGNLKDAEGYVDEGNDLAAINEAGSNVLVTKGWVEDYHTNNGGGAASNLEAVLSVGNWTADGQVIAAENGIGSLNLRDQADGNVSLSSGNQMKFQARQGAFGAKASLGLYTESSISWGVSDASSQAALGTDVIKIGLAPFTTDGATLKTGVAISTQGVTYGIAYNSVALGGHNLVPNKSNYAFAENLELQNGLAYYNNVAGVLNDYSGNNMTAIYDAPANVLVTKEWVQDFHATNTSAGANLWAVGAGQSSLKVNNGETFAAGTYAIATGRRTASNGFASYAGGGVPTSGFGAFHVHNLVASGAMSFAHFKYSFDNPSPTAIGAYADYSAILGGSDHNIEIGADNSAILGGSNNTMTTTASNSVILGGDGISADRANTAYTENLDVQGSIFLVPRLTTSERSALSGANLVEGMIVYDTDLKKHMGYGVNANGNTNSPLQWRELY